MLSHRTAVGRVQGTRRRRGSRRALSLLAAAITAVTVPALTTPLPSAGAATATVAVTGPAPSITGRLVVGSVLTADPGTWSPASATLSYQWYRSGSPVDGATAGTYTLREADRTARMSVVVIGRKSGYAARGRLSVATVPVLGRLTTWAPRIDGPRRVGTELTLSHGTWGPGLVRVTFQWYRSGVAVPGATGRRYPVTEADRLRQVSVVMIGRKDGYAAQARSSTPVRIWGEFTGGDPVITHFDAQTNTFTAVPGRWTPTPTTVRYQWYVWGGKPIPGATGLTYTVAPEYRRNWLQLKAFATRDYYLPGIGYSEETQPIDW